MATNSGVWAGIYIDVENLGSDEGVAKNIVRYALANWDLDLPPITSISLYGCLNRSMWEASIKGIVSELQGRRGPFAGFEPAIQVLHKEFYSRNSGKNTSDIALALDACEDMLSGKVGFVAVVSNDSDFFPLHDKANSLKESPSPNFPHLRLDTRRAGPPFLLINHPGNAGKSPTRNLIPATHLKTLPEEAKFSPIVVTEDEIAEAVVAEVKVGIFENLDIARVLKGNPSLSDHPASNFSGEDFDKFVAESLLPLLVARGVVEVQRAPAQYAMTESAKFNPEREVESPENIADDQPSDEDLINEIIRDWKSSSKLGGGFRAYDAQRVMNKRWPDNIYSKVQMGQFDNQFFYPLIDKTQRNEAAKIRVARSQITRLYEIVPDARGRNNEPDLTEMAKEVVRTVDLTSLSFSASQAQECIKERWPNCEFAKFSPSDFGNQFYFQIWPLLCDDRDAGRRSADKPSNGSYELPADAIQRLRSRFGFAG